LRARRTDNPNVGEARAALRFELAAEKASKAGAAQLAKLGESRNLKVHLGCGRDIRPGWINIEMFAGGQKPPDPEDGAVVDYDLRQGLPLPDGSCEVIYSSHFFEHLEYRHGVELMRQCHRCLQPGGTLRFCLPDLRLDMEAYLRGDNSGNEEFDALVGPDFGKNFELIRGLDPSVRGRAMAHYLNYAVYQYGEHKVIYDEETLRIELERIGFRAVEPSSHRHDLDPDDELRRKYSFFVEATK